MKHPIITSIGLAVLASISLVTPAGANLIIGNLPSNSAVSSFWLGPLGKAAVGVTMNADFDHITFKAMLRGDPGWLGGSAATVTAGIYDNSKTPVAGGTYPGVYYPGELLLSLGTVEVSGSNVYSDYQFSAVDPSFALNSGSTYYFMLSSSNNYVVWGAQSYAPSPFSPGDVATALSGTRWLDSTNGSYYDGQTTFFALGGTSLSAVPEVTSSFTLLGLISSGLLLRRRTKTLR